MECSAKEMSGVDEIFDTAVTMAVGDEYKASPSSGAAGESGGRVSAAAFSSGSGKKAKKRNCSIL